MRLQAKESRGRLAATSSWKRPGRDSPGVFGGRMALTALRFWASSLQTRERIDVC